MINPHHHISVEPTIVLKTASTLPSCSQRASVSHDATGGAREIPTEGRRGVNHHAQGARPPRRPPLAHRTLPPGSAAAATYFLGLPRAASQRCEKREQREQGNESRASARTSRRFPSREGRQYADVAPPHFLRRQTVRGRRAAPLPEKADTRPRTSRRLPS